MGRVVFVIGLLACLAASGWSQERDYEASIRCYRANDLDSAAYYVQRSVKRYRQTGQMDSLAFAYTQQALIVWSQQGLEPAIGLMDTASRIVAALPPIHEARVAVYGRLGQLYTQDYSFDKALRYLKRAEAAVGSNVPPNRHCVLLYNYLAVWFLMKEDYGMAHRYVQHAYDMNLLLEGRDGWDMVMVLQTRFLVSRYSGQLERALTDGVEFKRVAELRYSPGHPHVGSMHNSLATIYEALKRYDEALVHRQKAVGIHAANYRNTGDVIPLASAYQNLGYLYRYIQEPFLAEEYLNKGTRLLAAQHGDDGLGMVHPWAGLARLKGELGRFDEATELYQKAYDVQRNHDPDDRLGMAFVEGSLGDNYLDQERYDLAVSNYLRALHRYVQAGVMKGEDALYTKRGLALAKSALGQHDEAIALQDDVISGFSDLYPRGHVTIASMLLTLGRIYREADSWGQALAYSDSAATTLLKDNRFPGNVEAWFGRMPFSRFTVDFTNERALVLQGSYAQSGDRRYLLDLLHLVDGYSTYMEANLHFLRSQVALIEHGKINKSIYSAAMEACWILSRNGEAEEYLYKAFGYAERSKALLLRLASNGALIDSQRRNDDPVACRDRQFRQHINALNQQYLNNPDEDDLLNRLSVASEQYRLFLDSLKATNSDLFAARYTLAPPSVKTIRKALLRNKETLIEYAVTEQSVFAFVISPTLFRVHRSDRSVLDDVSKLRNLHAISAESFLAPSYRLYRTLFEPVRPYISSNNVLVVPDADLYYLNFEAMVSDDREHRFSHMPYLIKEYGFTYLLSAASAFQRSAVNRQYNKSRALLFAPVFTDEMKAAYREGLSDPVLEDRDYLYLYRQPFALQAALRIGQMLSHDLYIETQADERTFKSLAPNYRILHLGTHGEVNNDAPLQSRLFFARSPSVDSSSMDDGSLYAFEIYGMQLQAELAVLTACETGSGVLRGGEGVMSLAHSFMHAGCPSVVMSLWEIDEKVSSDLITKFYKNLKNGKAKDIALRDAKLSLLRSGGQRFSHPYYWAGLALIGDAAPLYTDYRSWYWSGALIFLAISWLAWRQFRRRRTIPKPSRF